MSTGCTPWACLFTPADKLKPTTSQHFESGKEASIISDTTSTIIKAKQTHGGSASLQVFSGASGQLTSPLEHSLAPSDQRMSVAMAERGLANMATNSSHQQQNAEAEQAYRQEGQKWIAGTKDKLFSWNFSVFEFGVLTRGNPLITMTMSLLEQYGLLDGWKINRSTIENFLLTVEAEYRPNAYHNSIHASDVTQTSAIIMESVAKHVGDISKFDIFNIIIASAIHDLGHLGVNNDFLINSRHPRATTYNDKSVNESYHVSRAFEIVRTARGCDIFELFTFEEQKKCRKAVVEMVLATDMAIHFDLLKRFNAQAEQMPDFTKWPEPSLLYQMLLHLADIANPARPFPLAKAWAERVIQEFCEQGDKEAASQLPLSPFCMRSTMDMPRAQLNFIEVFLRPTLLAYQKAAPQFVNMALECLDVTVREWNTLSAAGVKM